MLARRFAYTVAQASKPQRCAWTATRTMAAVSRPALAFQDPRGQAVKKALSPEQIKNPNVEEARKLAATRIENLGLTDTLDQLGELVSQPAATGEIVANCEESFDSANHPFVDNAVGGVVFRLMEDGMKSGFYKDMLESIQDPVRMEKVMTAPRGTVADLDDIPFMNGKTLKQAIADGLVEKSWDDIVNKAQGQAAAMTNYPFKDELAAMTSMNITLPDTDDEVAGLADLDAEFEKEALRLETAPASVQRLDREKEATDLSTAAADAWDADIMTEYNSR
eukprot:TRINITY_DN838_c0_g2_i1.p3 TRINITY_DN838_c0_g2~~TRINITY_DN838_c0_g2_i1.p3  ORF type:complete len:287 (+),score=91.71 TRINITY_DN838_c0_g2_i1:27-863(+)